MTFVPPLVEQNQTKENHRKESSCTKCRSLLGNPHRKGCEFYNKVLMEYNVPFTDLRTVTRSKYVKTSIYLSNKYGSPREHLWLQCGEVELRQQSNMDDVELRCYLTEGVTDGEHDSAHAFSLPLVAWKFKQLWYGQSHFTAIIPSRDLEDFRVPDPGYNPVELPDTIDCDLQYCEEPHKILPSGYYLPPNNPKLYEHVAGWRVLIVTGPKVEDE